MAYDAKSRRSGLRSATLCVALGLLHPIVVLLAVDAGALMILGAWDVSLRGSANVSIRRGIGFLAGGPRLAALERPGLTVGQGTAVDTILNALLLVDVTLHVRLHSLGRSGARVSR